MSEIETSGDVSRETSPGEVLEAGPAPVTWTEFPAYITDELNRVYKRLGYVGDLLNGHREKLDELLTDSRAARPLLDRYLKMTGGMPWARGGKGKRP